jgi:hypothetical protein
MMLCGRPPLRHPREGGTTRLGRYRTRPVSVVILAPDTRPLPVVLPTRFRPRPKILTPVRGLYRVPAAAELDFSDTAQLKLTI